MHGIERLASMAEQTSLKPFKYYIHDGIDECRLQIFGSFTEVHVLDISGCWATARTVLGNRKLVLDLRCLDSADEAGKMWIATLASEGAVILPQAPPPPQAKAAVFGKLGGLIRGLRLAGAESSTPVR